MNELTVSAVIPVYNGAPFIAEAITSVLRQEPPVLECIVVDDGSTDDTANVVSSFGVDVRLIRKPNGGVASARNRGIAEARGSLVAFLDADDMWLPTKIARQVERFGANGDLALVYTAMRLRRGEEMLGEVGAPEPEEALRNSLLLETPTMSVPSTGMFRRMALVGIGGFDERLSTSADTDLACRLAARHPVDVLHEPLVLYRLHPGQMHHDLVAFERDMSLVIDKAFSDPAVLTAIGDHRQRALANLHASIAGEAWQRRDFAMLARHALRAAAHDPRRLLRLTARRLRR